jgi:hypothetical protein
MKFIDNIVNKFLEFYYTKSLKENFIYTTKDKKMAFTFSTEDNIIRLYSNGVIYNIPIKPITQEQLEAAATDGFDSFIKNASVRDLKNLLKEYEEVEDYEKCDKIKKSINKKLLSNDE